MEDILKPMLNFARQMKNIAMRVATQMFNMFLKYVKRFFAIMRNLPGFIRRQSDMIIKLITTTIMSMINFFEKIAKSFEKVIKMLIQLPSMIFKLLNQIVDLFLNLVFIILKLPSALIGMVISLQEQGLSLMDKSFGIPFMDLFFK
jgi:phage-related protein